MAKNEMVRAIQEIGHTFGTDEQSSTLLARMFQDKEFRTQSLQKMREIRKHHELAVQARKHVLEVVTEYKLMQKAISDDLAQQAKAVKQAQLTEKQMHRGSKAESFLKVNEYEAAMDRFKQVMEVAPPTYSPVNPAPTAENIYSR
jgi:histidinol-phosphate/aromatic aminotransferase/cobyric acid decarboxylase-like protein